MDQNNKRQSQHHKWKSTCQYGDGCYRKNPSHFKDYSHPHLHSILQNGYKNESRNEFHIPSDLLIPKEILSEQIKILESEFPFLIGTASKKVNLTPETSTIIKPPDVINLDVEDSLPKLPATLIRSTILSQKPFEKVRLTLKEPTEIPKPAQSPKASTSTLAAKPSSSNQPKQIVKDIKDYVRVVAPKGQMADKLKRAAPYNMFLTVITDSKPTHNEPLSITFQELFDESLGELESSVQISFMVDAGWLMAHYYFAGIEGKPLLILHGDETPDLKVISSKKPNVTAIKVQMNGAFGIHHTKMMLLGYVDGSMRVVVSTANLYEDDWHNRTQGLWISPKLKPLPDDADTSVGDSVTEFRDSLLRYLLEYKQPKLQSWITRIRKTDFSEINVFLVTSVPGGHRDTLRGPPYGHPRLGFLLGKHCTPVEDSCPIVAQSSSIGSLGPNLSNWVTEFVNSTRKDSRPLGIRKIPTFKFIYPSFGNVMRSHDGIMGGGCLPYGKKTDDKQPWLKNHLQQWRARNTFRDKAMPHIKSYCRWTDSKLYWFHLTSANLSKAAWGGFNKTAKFEAPLRIMNWEAGVLFLPKFITKGSFFPMDSDKGVVPKFPMPYDVPLQQYAFDDKPFLQDFLIASMR